jgi:hypothetical protein
MGMLEILRPFSPLIRLYLVQDQQVYRLQIRDQTCECRTSTM